MQRLCLMIKLKLLETLQKLSVLIVNSLIVKEWSHQLLSHKNAFKLSAVRPMITAIKIVIKYIVKILFISIYLKYLNANISKCYVWDLNWSYDYLWVETPGSWRSRREQTFQQWLPVSWSGQYLLFWQLLQIEHEIWQKFWKQKMSICIFLVSCPRQMWD